MQEYRLDEHKFGEVIWRLMLREFSVSKASGLENCLEINHLFEATTSPDMKPLARIILESDGLLFQLEKNDSPYGGQYLFETVRDYIII